MRTLAVLALTVAATVCAPRLVFAAGGPPMITDDTGTPGPGAWEINTAALIRRTRSGSETELPLLDINYGVGERVQLKYEVPWTRSGLGESTVGVKWRFRDPGEAGWKISTYPQLELASQGEASSLLLPIELDRTFQRFNLSVEVGRERPSDGRGTWFAGAVLGCSLGSDLELLGEAHVDSVGTHDGSGFAALIGARWRRMPMGSLLISLGHEFAAGRDRARASFLGYVGWQFASNE